MDKAFLNRSYRMNLRIEAKKERIRQWRETAESITSVISGEPHSNSVTRKIETCAIEIAKLENEILDDIEALCEAEREIQAAINMLEKPNYKTVMELRYLNHMSWEAIAAKMHYSFRWVLTIHDEALKELISCFAKK